MAFYSVRTALSGMWREKWVNVLTVLTIATGLFLISAAYLVVHNMDRATRRLPDRFSITVFLADGVGDQDARALASSIKGRDGVREVRYISREDALKELRGALKDAEYILEGLEENPLPASLEVGLRKESVNQSSVKALSMAIGKMDGVAEVRYGEDLLAAIQSVKRNSQALGLALITALSLGLVFVCYSTVKILFYRKRAEIDTLKLLGATKSFIKGPFLIEGGLLGLAGGALSSAVMLALYYALYYRLAASMPLVRSIAVPAEVFQLQPAAGLLIGITGAYIAVGKIRF
ncbi:MAG: permease-like cell division protein FtsX [Thermodesulfovibrionales bacterium]